MTAERTFFPEGRHATLAEACDALPQLVLVVDRTGDDLTAVAANDAFVARFGGPIEGRPVSNLLPHALLTTLETAGGTVDGLVCIVRPVPGRPGRLVWSAADRSALALHVAALEIRNRELSRSNFDLDKFAYAASHDLAEPLRMVTSYLGLLETRYAEQLDDRARTYIGFAVEGATRMRHLIADVLALARLATSELAIEDVPLDDVLETVTADLRPLLAESDATIEAVPLPVVLGDAGQLRQLFTNLLSNAVKFSGPDTAPNIRIDARRTDDDDLDLSLGRWRIEVTDDGIGIPAELRSEAFEMFRRLQPRTGAAGTGIGLAICKQVVERHDGEIGIESSPTGGCTFWFTLRPATETST